MSDDRTGEEGDHVVHEPEVIYPGGEGTAPPLPEEGGPAPTPPPMRKASGLDALVAGAKVGVGCAVALLFMVIIFVGALLLSIPAMIVQGIRRIRGE